jgi:hypothetical protein
MVAVGHVELEFPRQGPGEQPGSRPCPPSGCASRTSPSASANTVGAGNLCQQAILIDHASDAVAPPDADVVQVGDIIWQRAQRRGLVQGAVSPMRVVEILVLAQDGTSVGIAETCFWIRDSISMIAEA